MENLVPTAFNLPTAPPRLRPLQARRGLGFLGRKLMLKKPVTLAYIGGSITCAPGYRVKTTNWFRSTFPQSTITEIDAGVGGTDSTLGAFRLQGDVLAAKPDLIFVEFSVNDGDQIKSAQPAMEGIVRHALRNDPQPELCFIYTLVDRHMDRWRENRLPPMHETHERIAEHYRIPSINVAMRLARDLIAGTTIWTDMFTDQVHPSPAGHEHYGTTIIDAMGQLLGMPLEGMPPREIPAALHPRPLEAGRLREFTRDTPIDGNGFAFKPMIKRGGWEPFAGVFESTTPGSEIAFKFEGTTLGVYFMLDKDGGDVEYSIDDAPFTHARIFDEFALKFVRPVPVMLSNDLMPGKHRLRVRVSDQRDARSSGNRVEIGALLYT